MSDSKPKIASICVHNSFRSQIAEALGNILHVMFLKAIPLVLRLNHGLQCSMPISSRQI